MTTKDVLVQARELIADPERWTQHCYAERVDGEPEWDPTSERACKWCAEGALMRAGSTLADEASQTLDSCARSMGDYEFANHLNDKTNHATVLRMFDCAIAKASE